MKETDQHPKDLILLNGTILTMDADDTIAEAIVTSNGVIEFVGSRQEAERYIRPESTVVDLEGKTLIPGMFEAHGHFPLSGMNALGVNLNSPPVGEFREISQVMDALKKKAQQTPAGSWVVGFGYDSSGIRENRMPDRHDLDAVSTDHPVYIIHVSGHLGSLNSRGLEAGHITAATPDPPGGRINRDGSGNPTGVLEESANMQVRNTVLELSPNEIRTMIAWATRDHLSQGITTAQCGNEKEEMFLALAQASGKGRIPIRLIAWPNYAWAEKLFNGELDVMNHNSEFFQAGAVKIVADGSIQAYTAHLSTPYYTSPDNEEKTHGYPVLERSTLCDIIEKYHRAGFQVAVHANGDAAIENVIHAISRAAKKYPREDTRHILVHCQTVRPDQLDRIRQLGVTASFFPAHIYFWGDRHRTVFLGPERAKVMNPLNSCDKRGIRFTIHLDTPVLPMNPMLLVWSAVTRKTAGGIVLGNDERISVMKALRSVTIDAAWQVFQEKNRGSLEKGKLADMVLLSDSPLDDPDRIREITVLKTYIGGKLVYDRETDCKKGAA